MVAVVEVQPVHILVHRVEHHDLHADGLQGVGLLAAEAHHAAEIVKEELDLHALRPLAAEDGQHPVEEVATGHDIVLQEDEPLRLLQMGQQVVEIRLAGVQIHRLRAVVQGEAVALHIAGQAAPLRLTLPQGRHGGTALGRLGGALGGKGQLFQRQALGAALAVPQPVEDQARHRHRQDQQYPANLIAAAAGTGIDPHGAEQCQDLQQGIGHGHPLLQELGKADDQGDLGQQQDRHQRQAQSRADPAFCLLLYLVLLHTAPFGIRWGE